MNITGKEADIFQTRKVVRDRKDGRVLPTVPQKEHSAFQSAV